MFMLVMTLSGGEIGWAQVKLKLEMAVSWVGDSLI